MFTLLQLDMYCKHTQVCNHQIVPLKSMRSLQNLPSMPTHSHCHVLVVNNYTSTLCQRNINDCANTLSVQSTTILIWCIDSQRLPLRPYTILYTYVCIKYTSIFTKTRKFRLEAQHRQVNLAPKKNQRFSGLRQVSSSLIQVKKSLFFCGQRRIKKGAVRTAMCRLPSQSCLIISCLYSVPVY